jgi:magnesium transporter
LERVRADPAVASGTFVTTITDVVGFFSFLGIATLWFGLKSPPVVSSLIGP